MKNRIITLLLTCSFSLIAGAETVQLQDNHPDRYVVIKGDTLWSISGRFLKDPWHWPQVWKMNRDQIKNPHKIYPGDVVILDTSKGEPELRLLRETVTLEPSAVEEPLEKIAIPAIPPSAIGPFLSQPLVVEESQLQDAVEIIGAPDDRIVLGAGYRAYASKIENADGINWQIFRPGEALVDPDTKKTLGYEAVYLGDAKVVGFGEPATISITKSKKEVLINDKLMPTPERLMTGFLPHAPESDFLGKIMTSYGGVAEIGRGAIVTLNRGSEDGLEEGHVLAVLTDGETLAPKPKKVVKKEGLSELNYTTSRDADGKLVINFEKSSEGEVKPVKLPDERIGLVMVFRTFQHVAYALVMQSERPLHVGDLVKTP